MKRLKLRESIKWSFLSLWIITYPYGYVILYMSLWLRYCQESLLPRETDKMVCVTEGFLRHKEWMSTNVTSLSSMMGCIALRAGAAASTRIWKQWHMLWSHEMVMWSGSPEHHTPPFLLCCDRRNAWSKTWFKKKKQLLLKFTRRSRTLRFLLTFKHLYHTCCA